MGCFFRTDVLNNVIIEIASLEIKNDSVPTRLFTDASTLQMWSGTTSN